MRILLNEGRNYMPDPRIVHGLGWALYELGHAPYYVNNDAGRERTPTVFQGIDMAIEVNQPRDEVVPPDMIHVSWIHDYIQARELDYDACCRDQDAIYTFGEGRIIGVPTEGWRHYRGSLLTGVRDETLELPPVEQDVDLSFAGYIPTKFGFWDDGAEWARQVGRCSMTMSDIMRAMQGALDKKYVPLRGALDPVEAMVWLKASLRDLLLSRGYDDEELSGSLWEATKKTAGKFLHEYTRLMDRFAVARMMLKVSDSLEFRGYNWDRFPEFEWWAKRHTFDMDVVINLYQRSRINVHNNIFGFALHTRVLEAMAVGGFVMAHETVHRGAAGQITETFEPDVHFGEYTAESFIERARYWLDNEEARCKAGAEARKVIRDKHLWRHRAAQILRDLGIKQTVAA